MHSKNKLSLCVLLILLLGLTPCVSQKVVIDSTKETTLLDKKATIAQGNIVKQRDTLFSLFSKQSLLIDSLRVESFGYRSEADTLRAASTLYKEWIREQESQIKFIKEQGEVKDQLFKSELKRHKGKKWSWLGIGALLGAVGFALFGG